MLYFSPGGRDYSKTQPLRNFYCHLGFSVSKSSACGKWLGLQCALATLSMLEFKLLISALLCLCSLNDSESERGLPGETVTGSLFWVMVFI